MEVGMGMVLWVKGIVLLTCLEGYVSSSISENGTMKEVMSQLHSLYTNPKQLPCNSSMVWKVDFNKEKLCAVLEVLNNVTNCPGIRPLQRNMNALLGNSSRNETCLEVQDTKIQLSRFLKDLRIFLLKSNRSGISNPWLGNFTKG
ncbi:interleukin-13-like [Trichosurus vulpecula]|uniref:interleukin-13-like n=1 Tax=Trichosurus vulpecula TaxID=9337 RepID=UPI00186B1A8C|nr:interleukin-13-like [Trichosurus vulpecula]XP_036605588.1 interleukin-13-like [Trichosurus vulpecula]